MSDYADKLGAFLTPCYRAVISISATPIELENPGAGFISLVWVRSNIDDEVVSDLYYFAGKNIISLTSNNLYNVTFNTNGKILINTSRGNLGTSLCIVNLRA